MFEYTQVTIARDWIYNYYVVIKMINYSKLKCNLNAKLKRKMCQLIADQCCTCSYKMKNRLTCTCIKLVQIKTFEESE